EESQHIYPARQRYGAIKHSRQRSLGRRSGKLTAVFRRLRQGTGRPLREQPCGSADARIAAFIETKSPVHVASDSNAHGVANRLRRPNLAAKPERTGGAQVNAVIALVDAHRGGKPARSSAQIADPGGLLTFALH